MKSNFAYLQNDFLFEKIFIANLQIISGNAEI